MHRHYLDLGINLIFWTARSTILAVVVNTFALIQVPSCFILMQQTLRVLLVCICTKSRMLQVDALSWENIISTIYCTSKATRTVSDYHCNSRRSACQELISLFYLKTCRGISERKYYFLETAVLIWIPAFFCIPGICTSECDPAFGICRLWFHGVVGKVVVGKILEKICELRFICK